VEFFAALGRPSAPDGFLLRDSVFYDEKDEFICALREPARLDHLDIPADLVARFNAARWLRDKVWDGTIAPAQLPDIATSLTWLSEQGNHLNAIQIQVDNLAFDSERHEIAYTLADVLSDLGSRIHSTDDNESYFSLVGKALDAGIRFDRPHGLCLQYLKKRELLERLSSALLSDDNGEEQPKNAL
jgi:hypothetical protein